MILIEKIKYIVRKINTLAHSKKVSSFHDRLKGEYKLSNTPTILSSNCSAGLIYHSLGLRFMSPTINLTIPNQFFFKFLMNLKWYLSQKLVLKEMVDNNSYPNFKYPICFLGDIEIMFNHYRSFEDASKKWNERKKRVNFDNLYVIVSEDTFSDEQLKQLSCFQCKRIVIFTNKKRELDNCFQLFCRTKKPYVGSFANLTSNGFRVYEREFNYAAWLNGDENYRL